MTKKALLTLSCALTACFNGRLAAQLESEAMEVFPAASASQCLPVCDDGPCFSLQAVAVNGHPVPPTTCVNVNSGDIIETEVKISDWARALPEGANIYQCTIDPEHSAGTGLSGVVLPLGWDTPIPMADCYTAADCPGTRWSCVGSYSTRPGWCRGPEHNPVIGPSLNVDRPDFVFGGYPLHPIVPYGIGYARLDWYTYFALLDRDPDWPMALDGGLTYYGATLWLRVSPDACGMFTYKFGESYGNYLCSQTITEQVTAAAQLFPLTISVDCDCNDDGIADWEAIAAGISVDCNFNGKPDSCDIRDGRSSDVNGDHIPDECRRRIDRSIYEH